MLTTNEEAIESDLDKMLEERLEAFLSAWLNAKTSGGRKLTDVWQIDRQIASETMRVFEVIAYSRAYPHSYGLVAAYENLVYAMRLRMVEKKKLP